MRDRPDRDTDPALYLELYEAGMGLRKFLEASTDTRDSFAGWRGSRAERLRNEADRIEAEDAAIIRFRKALKAIHRALGKDAESIEWDIPSEEGR
jgi:hypothetical protein